MWLIEENALVMAKEISLEVDTRWMFDNFYSKQLVTREMSVQFLRGGKSSRKTRLSSLVTTSSSTVSLMVIQLQSSRGRKTTVGYVVNLFEHAPSARWTIRRVHLDLQL